MNKDELIGLASDFLEASEDNDIETRDIKIFDTPIFGFADTNDVYFTKLKDPKAIGSHFKLPKEWLSSSKTVISFFLPFTEAVKESNHQEKKWPSPEWLIARIEGQQLINSLSKYLQSQLINENCASIIPSLDERFWSKTKNTDSTNRDQPTFTSNWSERHVAYVCGLGTFGLSKGLITRKGIAGRFGSIVTELKIEPCIREYEDIYENCSKWSACIKQCPVKAISFEKGKNHSICSDFLAVTADKFKPRYGCGKCQVNVPCESGIPSKSSL
ncbi:hypothetical protein [Acetobacterium bakii]|uniref:4Fe-4S ferredoxin n=1 Tax=Acetobacterium bakii TaxID=52689 RepID=A0A0L6TZ75_9FIRM|nr:hypothetical protein [Acetobacterium bakii]KNZ41558.1 4Fe-4S ferredoxin [Acetobacterium bakii]